jgi:hypothetical protein
VPKAKVGQGKAPDFVIRDRFGKWHVLECKGTQSGRGWRNKFLKDAIAQKHVINVLGSIRGERLAAGLSICNEQDKQETHLKIIDPDGDPLLTFESDQGEEMRSKARRISIARGLGIIGLNDVAQELIIPPETDFAGSFLSPNEIRQSRTSRKERSKKAKSQIQERDLTKFQHAHKKYEGRRGSFEFPELGRTALFNTISISQGVNREFLNEISFTEKEFDSGIEDILNSHAGDASVEILSEGSRTILTYGDILYAELRLKHA